MLMYVFCLPVKPQIGVYPSLTLQIVMMEGAKPTYDMKKLKNAK